MTFVTPEYNKYVGGWQKMITRLGGTPVVIRVASTGDWAKNCGLKPRAIISGLTQIRSPWFLYVDVDVRLLEAPTAPRLRIWDVGTTENLVKSHRNRISAATIFFNRTPNATKFLQEWQRRCAGQPGIDHSHLTHTLTAFQRAGRANIVDASRLIKWQPNGLRVEAETPIRPTYQAEAFEEIATDCQSAGGEVWYILPSIRPESEVMPVLSKWKSAGYRVAVQRDPGSAVLPVDLCIVRPYTGYAEAVNHLALQVLNENPLVQWVVTGGDDMLPDCSKRPEELATECTQHFKGTVGIMQPTGDRHLVDKGGKCSAERACVSPWLGRDWCLRANTGQGPFHPGYFHCFVDEELQDVASRLGRLWHRPDVNQFHDWRGRSGTLQTSIAAPNEHWEQDKALFSARKLAGFPCSVPLRPPVYVGYYTPGPYEDDALKLFSTLEELKLEHDFIRIAPTGTWQQITQKKAQVVRDALAKHAGRAVIYLDVDCLVLKDPKRFRELECDVAAAIFGGCELLSGTVYFGPTAKAREVVEAWIALNQKYPTVLPNGQEAWDQRTLNMAIKDSGCIFEQLPHSYTYMEGLSEERYPEVQPVILHTRGSLRHNPEHL
jgi:hypothetical protein